MPAPIPSPENSGAAQWESQQLTQSFPIKAKDERVEAKPTIHVTKNGTIGIRAESASNGPTDTAISVVHWMPVTAPQK